MSQTYVIKVSASVQESVDAKDKRRKKIVLTGIVPEDEQKEILGEVLKQRGWDEVEGEEGVYERKSGDVTERVDLKDMSVEAEVELERTLERNRTIVVRGDRDFEDVDERRRKEQRELEDSIAVTEQEREQVQTTMQREIAERLDETEEERSTELNEVVREVYAESLKRKAGRLGSVQEVREGRDGQDYELVIRITE